MNVFMVETTHQLLNAIEAKHFLGLRDSHLVVVLLKEYPQSAYAPLVRTVDWTTVHYVPQEIAGESALQRSLKFHKRERIRGYFHTYELLVLRRCLDAIARSLGKVKNVFLGNYAIEYMRHFANVLNHEKLYLLDDGTTTILINKFRRDGRHLDNYKRLQRLKVRFSEALMGMKVKQAASVTFFTAYDLTTKDGDQVVKHDYPYLRSVADAVPPSAEVFFLGQPLLDVGLSRERYFDYFKKVLRYFDGETLVYITHKVEPPEKIAYIKEELGVQVVRFGVPIEYQLTMRSTRPRVLASFCSSALESCRIIFGDELEIKSFYIDPGDCPLNPDLVREIYAYYESKSSPAFEVVRL